MPADSDASASGATFSGIPASRVPFSGVTVPTPPIANDDGQTSPALRDALTGDSGSGEHVLAALVGARLFVPVVAVADEVERGVDGLTREKHSTMASVSMEDEAGRRSLLAFTCIDELTEFNSDARPVPIAGPLAAQAALAEGAHALVIDVSGQAPFAVVAAELETLAAAAGGGATNLGLRSALARHLNAEPEVVAAYLDSPNLHSPGGEGDTRCELVVLLPPELTREQYQGLLARLSERFANDRAIVVATSPDAASSQRQGLTIRVVATNDQHFTRQPGDTPSLW